MSLNFAFFHVGKEEFPIKFLINSIRKTNPSASIIQITDKVTKKINDVDLVWRANFDVSHIMHFRSKCWDEITREQPNKEFIFIDTDFLVLKDMNKKELFDNAKHDLSITIRSKENLSSFINPNFPGFITFPELEGKTWKEIMPYNNGIIFTKSNKFWKQVLENHNSFSEKYKIWYGDQISVFKTINSGIFKTNILEERVINFIPKKPIDINFLVRDSIKNGTYAIHFKGNRKKYIEEFYNLFFSN